MKAFSALILRHLLPQSHHGFTSAACPSTELSKRLNPGIPNQHQAARLRDCGSITPVSSKCVGKAVTQLDEVGHTCMPSTWETEAKGWGLKTILSPIVKFKASLS